MSRMEQLIGEIEAYLDSCKYQPFTSKILVNKEEMEELLMELRLHIPEEIKRCQKLLSNEQAIREQAQKEASAMLEAAKVHTNELVNEHQIMQQAYSQADSVVAQAQAQAQAIVDRAIEDANGIRQGSIQYTDDMLRSLQTIIEHTMEGAKGRFDAFMTSMQSSYEIVNSNRNELSSGIIVEQEEAPAELPPEQQQ